MYYTGIFTYLYKPKRFQPYFQRQIYKNKSLQITAQKNKSETLFLYLCTHIHTYISANNETSKSKNATPAPLNCSPKNCRSKAA